MTTQTVGPITVAHWTGSPQEAAGSLSHYVRSHSTTVKRFDGTLLSGSVQNEVDERLVAATRIMNSRISRTEVQWFVQHAQGAPWDLIEGVNNLAEIDACRASSRWDDVTAFFRYFRDGAPSGIASSKIHKVLHRVRPGLFPILDRRLQSLYRQDARAWATRVRACRPELPAASHQYWMAIRNDLVESLPGLASAQAQAAMSLSDMPDLAVIVTSLSPLRVLDILSWELTAKGA